MAFASGNKSTKLKLEKNKLHNLGAGIKSPIVTSAGAQSEFVNHDTPEHVNDDKLYSKAIPETINTNRLPDIQVLGGVNAIPSTTFQNNYQEHFPDVTYIYIYTCVYLYISLSLSLDIYTYVNLCA